MSIPCPVQPHQKLGPCLSGEEVVTGSHEPRPIPAPAFNDPVKDSCPDSITTVSKTSSWASAVTYNGPQAPSALVSPVNRGGWKAKVATSTFSGTREARALEPTQRQMGIFWNPTQNILNSK